MYQYKSFHNDEHTLSRIKNNKELILHLTVSSFTYKTHKFLYFYSSENNSFYISIGRELAHYIFSLKHLSEYFISLCFKIYDSYVLK